MIDFLRIGASLVAQRLKRLLAMQETLIRSLGWEDCLEKEMATHSSILSWRIPWTRSLVGYSPRGHKESARTERLHFSFRIDWFDLLAVQGTLKSLLQHHSLKSVNSLVLSLLYGPLSHQYVSTGKAITSLWLYGPFSAKWCLCFSLCSLGLS